MGDVDIFMPLYIGDYEADTRHLTCEQDGAYLRLLRAMWRTPDGSLKHDERRLRVIVGHIEQPWDELWSVLREFFNVRDGRIYQERLSAELERARDLRKARVERAQRAAEARWGASRAEREDEAGAEPVDRDPGAEPGVEEEAMLGACSEHCLDNAMSHSPSHPPSPLPTHSPPETPAPASAAPERDARAVLEYLNDLAGTGYGTGRDAEYLRERLAEGRSFDDCCRAVEAAVASGKLDDLSPRRVFSERWFGDLLALRLDPKRWRECEERFDEACERTLERVPPPVDEIDEDGEPHELLSGQGEVAEASA